MITPSARIPMTSEGSVGQATCARKPSSQARLTLGSPGGSIHDRMPFAYFQRLTRRQQGIYLRSEKITQVALPAAAAMRPLVVELGAALESDDRALTKSACQLLAGAMARALGLPPVPVTVLAARPHARCEQLAGSGLEIQHSNDADSTVWHFKTRPRSPFSLGYLVRPTMGGDLSSLDDLPTAFHVFAGVLLLGTVGIYLATRRLGGRGL